MPRAIIFANGMLPDVGAARQLIKPDDYLIAADGGARHAIALGVIPNLIIGDLDSLSEAEVRVYTDMGIHILKFPANKDESDLELALDHATRADYSPIVIVAGLGNRTDQTIANISLLAAPELQGKDVRLDDGQTEVFVVTSQVTIHGAAGDIVSLQPLGAPAEGVSTDGLTYPLNKETLLAYRTRGISNQMLADTAKIRLKRGVLCVIHQRNSKTK